MERMRPDDHFMVVLETDATPMHIGALLLLEVPEAKTSGCADMIRAHLTERLKYTPLLRILREAPNGYDSDAWFSVSEEAAQTCIHHHASDAPLDDPALYGFIARTAMQRIDLSGPPFEIHILDYVSEGRVALYVKVHHCVTDGVGFQHLLGALSDDQPEQAETILSGFDETIPSPEEWRQQAEALFAMQEEERTKAKTEKKASLDALKAFGDVPGQENTPTPDFALSAPTSDTRNYRTLSVSLDRLKSQARALDAKINDVFLWIASTALRTYLIEHDLLPEQSLSVNSARSYRQDQHGHYGNRIVALRPKLATDIEDPMERLREIQTSMRVEVARSDIEQRLLDQPEIPCGAARRREHFSKRTENEESILAGNITLSNVPGPTKPRYYAGFRQLANYPIPLLGSGRFLNITSRRNEDYLDWGVMVDPEKIKDMDRLLILLQRAVAELDELARTHATEQSA